jgi:transcriptional regulator with XRE-family HTH domain
MLPESANPRSELALFLKFLRQRVDPDVRSLGPYPRLPCRLGKRVTQQELAEAIGVSREWYAMLESAAATGASPGLLKRVADAVTVTPEERARLFQLGLPENWRVRLRDDSTAALEAFSRLRSFARRLWTATSIEDVLATASEQIADWFDNPVLVHTSRRCECGLWESQPLDDKQDQNKLSKVIRELQDHVLRTSQEIDALNLYPQLANAGDVGTPDFQPLPLQREVLKAYARRRLTGFTFLKSRVRSRTGLISSFSIFHELGHSYSPSDHAALGAFADFASLALS